MEYSKIAANVCIFFSIASIFSSGLSVMGISATFQN